MRHTRHAPLAAPAANASCSSILALFLLPIAARAALYASRSGPGSWRDADWSSTGMLPPARDYRRRGVLVIRRPHRRLEGHVRGAQLGRAQARERRDLDPLRRGRLGQSGAHNGWAPDGRWFGNMPVVLADMRGAAGRGADPEDRGRGQGLRYDKAGDYRIWPGPNSNTFIAAVLRAVPELERRCRRTPSAATSAAGFYAGLTDSRTGVEVKPLGRRSASSSAGSRASRSICSAWSPASTSAIRR